MFMEIQPNNRLKLTVVCTAFILCAFLSTPSFAADEKISDYTIRKTIAYRLSLDESISAHLIDISVKDGIVTFSGTADNILAKERASWTAHRIRGVINLVEVKPAAVSDEKVLREAENCLRMDPAARSYDIELEIDEGIITLTGEVESWQRKRLAETVVKSVSGVKGVENKIAVVLHDERSDRDIKADIEKALHWDNRVNQQLIEVEVRNGIVTLSGIVGSSAEKIWAAQDSHVLGARQVVNEIEVEDLPLHRNIRGDRYIVKTDDAIASAIKDALVLDPRVEYFAPEVEVSGGEVTLTGTVGNLKAKKAAEQVAKDTVGVWRVKNLLRVRPPVRPPDAELEQAIEERLRLDPEVDGSGIGVTVFNGRAYLHGGVDSQHAKTRAGEAASGVEGVIDVSNKLVVAPPKMVTRSDLEIQRDIESQMFWSPFVDGDQVDVSVHRGVAVLKGTVDSYRERSAAVENALEGGAIAVDNQLEVKESQNRRQ